MILSFAILASMLAPNFSQASHLPDSCVGIISAALEEDAVSFASKSVDRQSLGPVQIKFEANGPTEDFIFSVEGSGLVPVLVGKFKGQVVGVVSRISLKYSHPGDNGCSIEKYDIIATQPFQG